MALNKIIKALMEERNIGSKELSEKSGVPLRTINNIISGVTENPTLETMRAISKVLNCTLDDFVDEQKEPANNGYYLDEEAAKLAQEIYDNPDLRILFDTTRKVKPEDLKFIAEMVKRMSGDND